MDTINFADNDVAAKILTEIFGAGWNEGLSLGPAQNIIVVMLNELNIVMMSVAVIMISFTVVQGVIGTAHDGTPLGKKFSSLWTPIRGVTGLSLVSPVFGGLCGMQMIIMMAIAYSCVFANTVSKKALDFVATNDYQFSANYAETTKEKEIIQIARATWISGLYQAYKSYLHFGEIDNSFNVDVKSDENGNDIIYFKSVHDSSEEANVQGERQTMKIIVLNSRSNQNKERTALVVEVVGDTLALLAKAIDEHFLQGLLKNWNEKSVRAMRTEYYMMIYNLRQKYKAFEKNVIETRAYAETRDGASDIFFDRNKIVDGGWIMSGSIYLHLLKEQMQMQQYLNEGPVIQSPDFNDIALRIGGDDRMMESRYLSFQKLAGIANVEVMDFEDITYRLKLKEVSNVSKHAQALRLNYVDDSEAQNLSAEEQIENMVSTTDLKATVYSREYEDKSDTKFDFGNIKESISKAINNVVKEICLINNNENPFISMMQTGGAILKSSTMLWTGAALANMTAGGFFKNFIDISAITGFLMTFSAIGVGLGFLYLFWMPIMPFLIWFWQVIAWVLTCVEALVAAPLWAVAHSMPEGDGFAGQHARQGYMLLTHVLLRPVLMVIGFFIALYLCQFTMQIISFLFLNGVGSFFINYETAGFGSSIISIILKLAVAITTTVLLFGTITKLFSLVSLLPENLLRWLGQHIQGFGAEADADRNRAQAKQALGQVGGAVSSAASIIHVKKSGFSSSKSSQGINIKSH
jgi:conjugal transfer/type IV secretion protein DotA/TraY